MVPRLLEYLNQSILVSIPVLHSDVKCRSYTLAGVELQGLWLQSEELLRDLLDDEEGSAPASTPMFVPFGHIACVVLSAPGRKLAGFPASLRTPAVPVSRAPAQRSAKDAEAAHKKKRGK